MITDGNEFSGDGRGNGCTRDSRRCRTNRYELPGFTELMNGIADISRGRMIIAIDGPSASGKGTLSKHLAYSGLPIWIPAFIGPSVTVVRQGGDPEDEATALAVAGRDPATFPPRNCPGRSGSRR